MAMHKNAIIKKGNYFMENLQMLKIRECGDTYDIEESITRLLFRICMPVSIRGYSYLKTAIAYAMDDPERIYSITKQIYPYVAKKHGSTPSRVERAMRHAIERAWCLGDIKNAVEKYGYSFRDYEFKPTNSEFIAETVEILQRESRLGCPIYFK